MVQTVPQHTAWSLRTFEDISFRQNELVAVIGFGDGSVLPELLEYNPVQLLAVDTQTMIALAAQSYTSSRIRYFGERFMDLIWPSLDTVVLLCPNLDWIDRFRLKKWLQEYIKQYGSLIVVNDLEQPSRLADDILDDPAFSLMQCCEQGQYQFTHMEKQVNNIINGGTR